MSEKRELVLDNLQKHQLDSSNLDILFVAYKDLDRLELFAKHKQQQHYKLLQLYKICARSGKLGPKKAEGDKQVPEGFYHINRFNPKSKFYLSLGLNYPNAFDLAHNYTGTDIFIHGKCMTVGCLPMTDEYMKEIYLYALWAKDSGQQNIPVYIFPFEMIEENMLTYKEQVNEETYAFWQNIQQGYLLFEESKKELDFTIVEKKYQFTH
ncbi:L,D-transpeptidase family protein [Sphingobacterium composti Ten et al. 2007 non Yoo et al. 2007]|uniref:L,D-transpeptidase family protein n=1 Tax=Sphingobacterium composti TaxID=363260 RepID=UPI0019166D17|nr:L,D-transpeptidase family protein [Sphingobacterium composti Ten et al. 2007 non Yoo et al. 2007]